MEINTEVCNRQYTVVDIILRTNGQNTTMCFPSPMLTATLQINELKISEHDRLFIGGVANVD
jgi:hypothetical protein